MIRKAEINDVDLIYHLFKEAHVLTDYHHLDDDEALVKKTIVGYILGDFAYIADNDTGVLLAKVAPFWFSREKTLARDLVFYVRPGHKKIATELISEYITWAESKADYVGLSVSIGGDLMDKAENFYTRFGFKRVGGDFVRGL